MEHGKIALGMTWLLVSSTVPSHLQGADDRESSKTIRYLRVSGSEFVQETEIHLMRKDQSFVVTSNTQRGEQKLTVTSRFDSKNLLTSAKVTLQQGEITHSASVRVMDRKARVEREGNQANELTCPAGVIVTSAPDWTDSYMAVRRYDPKGSKTQKFPGLWIHPTREPLELTIKVTRLGLDSVMLRDKSVKLDRFLLELRGGSRYIVWRGERGQLVRLVPVKTGKGGIVLTGWERATRDLQPKLLRD